MAGDEDEEDVTVVGVDAAEETIDESDEDDDSDDIPSSEDTPDDSKDPKDVCAWSLSKEVPDTHVGLSDCCSSCPFFCRLSCFIMGVEFSALVRLLEAGDLAAVADAAAAVQLWSAAAALTKTEASILLSVSNKPCCKPPIYFKVASVLSLVGVATEASQNLPPSANLLQSCELSAILAFLLKSQQSENELCLACFSFRPSRVDGVNKPVLAVG